MTTRETLAGFALAGLCARAWPDLKVWERPFVEYASQAAAELADETLAALKRKKEHDRIQERKTGRP